MSRNQIHLDEVQKIKDLQVAVRNSFNEGRRLLFKTASETTILGHARSFLEAGKELAKTEAYMGYLEKKIFELLSLREEFNDKPEPT